MKIDEIQVGEDYYVNYGRHIRAVGIVLHTESFGWNNKKRKVRRVSVVSILDDGSLSEPWTTKADRIKMTWAQWEERQIKAQAHQDAQKALQDRLEALLRKHGLEGGTFSTPYPDGSEVRWTLKTEHMAELEQL